MAGHQFAGEFHVAERAFGLRVEKDRRLPIERSFWKMRVLRYGGAQEMLTIPHLQLAVADLRDLEMRFIHRLQNAFNLQMSIGRFAHPFDVTEEFVDALEREVA